MTDQEWFVLAALLGALMLAAALRVLVGIRFLVSGGTILVTFGFVFVIGLLGQWWEF